MNAARPLSGAIIAQLADVPDNGAIAVDFANGEQRFSVLLARRGSQVFAFENQCTHARYPLQRSDGRVIVQQERYIVCSMHGASFEMTTGACAGGPCNGEGLTSFAIVVRDGVVVAA